MKIVDASAMKTMTGSDPTVPESFGFGLLTNQITNGTLTAVVTLDNRYNSDVTITWVNSHLFIVTITDVNGSVCKVNDAMPPPVAQPPLVVAAGTIHTIIYPFDPSAAPFNTLKFSFDPAKSPYTIDFVMNSTSHFFAAKVTLPVT